MKTEVELLEGQTINDYFEADADLCDKDFDGWSLQIFVDHEDKYAGYILDDGSNDAQEVVDDYYAVCEFLDIDIGDMVTAETVINDLIDFNSHDEEGTETTKKEAIKQLQNCNLYSSEKVTDGLWKWQDYNQNIWYMTEKEHHKIWN